MCKRVTVLELDAVSRMLNAGLRHVEIARELDLSVSTIARIADDRRRGRELTTGDQLPEDDAPPDYVARNLQRCPGCGAMVYLWPCLACRLSTTARPVEAPEHEYEDETPDVWAELMG